MKHQHKLSSATMAHLNELLDEALKQTFPASDPIAINIELDQWNAELVSSSLVRPERRKASKLI